LAQGDRRARGRKIRFSCVDDQIQTGNGVLWFGGKLKEGGSRENERGGKGRALDETATDGQEGRNSNL